MAFKERQDTKCATARQNDERAGRCSDSEMAFCLNLIAARHLHRRRKLPGKCHKELVDFDRAPQKCCR